MSESPRYSPAEEFCNCATHAFGALLTLGGTFLLVSMAFMYPRERVVYSDGGHSGQTAAEIVAVWESYAVSALIYGASIFAMFLISAMYHAARTPEVKAEMRKCDHAAIYFAIAGTYVPIVNAIMPFREGLVWYCGLGLCAVVGAVSSFVTLKHKYVTTTVYLIMGWASLLLLRTLWRAADPLTTYLLIAGGAVYSLGAALYLIRKPFMHAVFHVFVLGGAALQYLAIYTLYINH